MRRVYDTRFFVEHYYSGDEETLRRTREELRRPGQKIVPTVVVHELYKLTLEKEGRDTAKLRAELLRKEFKLVALDYDIAVSSAEIRRKYRIPMADSIIAATALKMKATCITDDPHITSIKKVKTKWIK